MSLSSERPTNPAKRFLEVKSGALSYYDKDLKQNVEVDTPFEFIVLDQLATIKGWSDADESGYWSNEVRSVGRDVLTVRTSKGVKESGIWRDIKGSSNVAGAQYRASIYLAHKSDDGLSIANLNLKGAALNAWIEFTQKNRVTSSKVVLSGWTDGKKGAVKYKVPVFESVPFEDGEKEVAIGLDKELQSYLSEYFNSTPEDNSEVAVKDVAPEDIDLEEPVDLSEIPF